MNILIICNFINNLVTKLLTLLEISEKIPTFAMIIKEMRPNGAILMSPKGANMVSPR